MTPDAVYSRAMSGPSLRSSVLLLGLAFVASPALAEDTPPKATGLPGVEGNYSIVGPAPEPAEPPADPSAPVKLGKWELTVSGYVWVQIGSSSSRRD